MQKEEHPSRKRHVHCPNCGTARLRVRNKPDRIDQLESNPFNRLKRHFGGRLYHCIYCRYQFYDFRELTPAPPKPVPPSPAPTPLPPVIIPAVAQEATPAARYTIGSSIRMEGSITAGEDVCIDGIFDGELEARDYRVTIGPGARVNATIRARELIVQGHLAGGYQIVEKVTVRDGAVVSSDVFARAVQVEDGAVIRGRISMEMPVENTKARAARA